MTTGHLCARVPSSAQWRYQYLTRKGGGKTRLPRECPTHQTTSQHRRSSSEQLFLFSAKRTSRVVHLFATPASYSAKPITPAFQVSELHHHSEFKLETVETRLIIHLAVRMHVGTPWPGSSPWTPAGRPCGQLNSSGPSPSGGAPPCVIARIWEETKQMRAHHALSLPLSLSLTTTTNHNDSSKNHSCYKHILPSEGSREQSLPLAQTGSATSPWRPSALS